MKDMILMTRDEMTEHEFWLVLTVLRSSEKWREWSESLKAEDVAERVRSYTVEDGRLIIPGSSWAAIVVNPSAAKPVYDGGDVMPDTLQVGDVIVWGSRDKKRREEGPFFRLVYFVSETEVRCLAVDY